MRDFRYLLPVCLTGLLLLLLSGLVVGPASENDVSQSPAMEAVLMPAPVPPAGDGGDTSPLQSFTRPDIFRVIPLSSGLPTSALALRDANGRPVFALNYLESVYLIFRQEIAAG